MIDEFGLSPGRRRSDTKVQPSDIWLTQKELRAIEEAALAIHDGMPISAEHHRYLGAYGWLDMNIKLDYP